MRLLTYVLVALACLPATFAQKFYELEPINYSKSEAEDAIADYFSNPENLEAWKSEGDKGYLTNFLEAFNIPTASQVLVLSKTSLQVERIFPKNPRAIYYNDNIYVGWVPSSDMLEISVSSPTTGTNFYSFKPVDGKPKLTRQTHDCLRCHGGSFTRDVPGHLLRSVYPDFEGQPIFKAGTHFTDQTTPLENRWGGWLVSRSPMDHMGNTIFKETDRGADQGEFFTLKDIQNRSLFELQMNGRMLRYPFSYLIYSDTFNNMPPEALNYLWAEIERILEPTERREGYEGLSRRNKIAIKEILLETHPSAKKYW